MMRAISAPRVTKPSAPRFGASSRTPTGSTVNYSYPRSGSGTAAGNERRVKRTERTIHIDERLWMRLESRYTQLRASAGERAPKKSEFLEQVIGAGLAALESELPAQGGDEPIGQGQSKRTDASLRASADDRRAPVRAFEGREDSKSWSDDDTAPLELRLSADVRNLLEAAAARRNESIHTIIQRGILTELERLALNDASESLYNTPSAQANGGR